MDIGEDGRNVEPSLFVWKLGSSLFGYLAKLGVLGSFYILRSMHLDEEDDCCFKEVSFIPFR